MLLEEPSRTVGLFVEPLFQVMYKNVEQMRALYRTRMLLFCKALCARASGGTDLPVLFMKDILVI